MWFHMIIEGFNWVSADLSCVRTDHCWKKKKAPPGHRRAMQLSDGSICYTIKQRWDFYYCCCLNKLMPSYQMLCTRRSLHLTNDAPPNKICLCSGGHINDLFSCWVWLQTTQHWLVVDGVALLRILYSLWFWALNTPSSIVTWSWYCVSD